MSKVCQYNTQPGNVPCGDPATHQHWSGAKWFPTCTAHADLVRRRTKGQCDPTPLPGVVVEEKSALPLPLPVAAGVPPAVDGGILPPVTQPQAPGPAPNASIIEQIRRFREQQANQGD